jgi:hypothetical protein
LIIFPAKHLLLPLLQYSIGVDTFFVKILEGFENVLRWSLDRGGHGRDGGCEGGDGGGGLFSRESRIMGVEDGEI